MGVDAAKSDGAAVVVKMKEILTDDIVFGKGRLREEDARSTTSSLRGEKARDVAATLGLLSACAHDAWRGRLPAIVGGPMPNDLHMTATGSLKGCSERRGTG